LEKENVLDAFSNSKYKEMPGKIQKIKSILTEFKIYWFGKGKMRNVLIHGIAYCHRKRGIGKIIIKFLNK